MGGSAPKAQSGPTPQEVAQAQIDVQRREQERLTAERNTNADSFLAQNVINDDWRNDIASRSQATTDNQLAVLGNQYRGTMDDIRQRQSGRGLANSGTRYDLDRQAGTLLDQSRNDILNAGQKRVSDRIAQQNNLLTRAGNAIRGGTPVGIAESNYQRDIEDANNAFDFNLRNAMNHDQRNRAFLDFENRRQMSANKFKESVNRMEDDELLAARALNQPADDEENNAGQFGTSSTNII